MSLAYGCEKNLSRSTLLQYIHQNRNHNGRRIDTIGDNILFHVFSSLFAGKVIEDEVLEKITEQEAKIANNLELIRAMSKEVATIEATVRDLPNNCKSLPMLI